MKKHVVYTLIWDAGYYYHGSTGDFIVREKSHLSRLRNGTRRNRKMQNVFNKHGEWASVFLRSASSESNAIKIEQELIDRDFIKTNCLNLNPSATKPPKRMPEQLSESAKIHYANNLGAMTGRQRIAQGKENYRRRVGIHALTSEQKSAAGKEGGKVSGPISAMTNRKNNTAVFGMSFAERSAAGKEGGKKAGALNYLNKTGIFGMSKEKKIAARKKGLHNRWHVRRGIINLDCGLCRSLAKV